MKKIISFFVLLLLTMSIQAGNIVTDSINSKILNSVVKYNVYLPDGFDKPTTKYPVVYLLHGLSGTYKEWDERGNAREIADELISSGEAVPMVIVMPNAGHPEIKKVWNGYFDMPGWQYETFFFTELLPEVEKKYRVIGDKEHRAIMGLSMGGGGSTVYCQHHPEMFSSCYAMSAWLETGNPEGGYKGKDKFFYTLQSVYNNSTVRFLENADDATKEKLRTVRWFFDCGDDDQLMGLSVKMHDLSKNNNIKDELRIRNGIHNWEYWRTALRLALPFASDNFAR